MLVVECLFDDAKGALDQRVCSRCLSDV